MVGILVIGVIILAAIAAMIDAGEPVVSSITDKVSDTIGQVVNPPAVTKDDVRRALRSASLSYNLNPDWLDAIGKVESNWTMSAKKTTGSDGLRGGAWGPTQMTQTTARALGYEGPMEAFNNDVSLAADWSAQNLARVNPMTFDDAAVYWNGGELLKGTPPDSSAFYDYLPKARIALAYVQSHPVEDAIS